MFFPPQRSCGYFTLSEMFTQTRFAWSFEVEVASPTDYIKQKTIIAAGAVSETIITKVDFQMFFILFSRLKTELNIYKVTLKINEITIDNTQWALVMYFKMMFSAVIIVAARSFVRRPAQLDETQVAYISYSIPLLFRER